MITLSHFCSPQTPLLNGDVWFFYYKYKSCTYVLTCGTISCVVCLHASTHDRLSLRIFSRSSGQSRDWPMCINKSRNNATWLFISMISWKKINGKRDLSKNILNRSEHNCSVILFIWINCTHSHYIIRVVIIISDVEIKFYKKFVV